LVQTFHERYNGGAIKRVFLLLLAAVGFVLLTVCANVANMMLSRALARQREISIRAALGASGWRLIRQLLIESIVLSTLGGVLGLAFCALGVRWFDLVTRDVGKPYWVQFTMDYTVFGYFGAICLFTGLLFGLAPALRSSRLDLNGVLKDGTRSTGSRRGGRLSGFLVVGQFALTLVLLTGAGVFVRGFLDGLSINKTVPSSQLLTAAVRLPKERYPAPDTRQHFFDQLLPRLAALPGVSRMAMVSNLPGTWAPTRHIELEDARLADPAHGPSALVLVQSQGYFDTVDLPILAGRDFNASDGAAGAECAIVTKEFAEKHWPNQLALGKRFRFFTDNKFEHPGPWLAVVGVSANLVQSPSEATPDPLVFLPYRQDQSDSMFVMVRSTGNPTTEVSGVRAAVQSLDQDLPLFEVGTLAHVVERSQWFLRVFGVLFSVFAAIALLIAAVGFYAVIAQATGSRTREIGVRMALGATRGNILVLIFRRGLTQLIAGLVLGLAGAFPAARLLTHLLVRVSPTDPLVFASVGVLLTAVGLCACWLPARRAASLHPVSAIRYD
ncbi:MAG TPA: FtsX-like permease family protein, partial [Blastocatellia bacterium]|nr:FtsX-like permease family protein [Blastocatellia bacterium]